MKLNYALFLVTATIGACLGVGSAVLAAGQGLPLSTDASLTSGTESGAAVILIEDDGDAGEGGWFRLLSNKGNNDNDDQDDDDDCEDEDEGGDDCASGAAGNAAKAGTVAPPKNGLFTNGTAPVVKSN